MSYGDTKAFTESTLADMRLALKGLSLGNDLCVGTAGSFARREASRQSDLDFFFLHGPSTEEDALPLSELVSTALADHVPKRPAIDGAFNKAESISDMLTNIGGQGDDNAKMTRRILVLLEGEWLYNEVQFSDVRSQLLSRYLAGATDRTQIALFLLNDVIRYYRTVCVDYEYKTVEHAKPWGIRNIKLMFSRKLIYVSGVVAIGRTHGLAAEEKINELARLFTLPPIDRIRDAVGRNANVPLGIYDIFLTEIAKDDVRTQLECMTRSKRNKSSVYRELKNLGYAFSDALLDMFYLSYGPRHPLSKWLLI